ARARVADLWLPAHLAVDQDEGVIEQAAVVQVLEEGGEVAVELRKKMLTEAVEVTAMRVPAPAALAQGIKLRVFLGKDGNERHPGFDQPPGHQNAHGIE